LYEKIATPWMSLIILLVSLPLLGKSNIRKGMVLSIIICLILVFAYHVSNAFFLALGKKGMLPPAASAWLAHILFGAGALLFMKRANY